MPASIPTEIKPEVDSILEAIVYLYTESRRVTKEVARSAELTGPQLTVLKVLEGVGDLSLSELSERIRAQNSTVTGIIDRMEREGLVVRARSTEDRRVVNIQLTEKGARIAREPPPGPPDDLYEREVEVLRLIALGHTNAEIAETAGMWNATQEIRNAATTPAKAA